MADKQVKDQSLTVEVEWDDEGGVWVAFSDDIPGLVTQERDFRILRDNVLELAPILLVANCGYATEAEAALVPIRMVVLPEEAAHRHAA